MDRQAAKAGWSPWAGRMCHSIVWLLDSKFYLVPLNLIGDGSYIFFARVKCLGINDLATVCSKPYTYNPPPFPPPALPL